MLDARREFLWDYPGSRVHERILQAAARVRVRARVRV